MSSKSSRLFIGCLPGDSDPVELLRILNNYGKVLSVNLVKSHTGTDSHSHYCLGYGFIKCGSPEDANAILLSASHITYCGRQIIIRKYNNGLKLKAEREELFQRRIYLGKVPKNSRENVLYCLLKQYGDIEYFYLMENPIHPDFKYGFAVYKSIESTQQAVSSLNNLLFYGSRLRVEYCSGKRQDQLPHPEVMTPTPIYNSNGGSPDGRLFVENLKPQRKFKYQHNLSSVLENEHRHLLTQSNFENRPSSEQLTRLHAQEEHGVFRRVALESNRRTEAAVGVRPKESKEPLLNDFSLPLQEGCEGFGHHNASNSFTTLDFKHTTHTNANSAQVQASQDDCPSKWNSRSKKVTEKESSRVRLLKISKRTFLEVSGNHVRGNVRFNR